MLLVSPFCAYMTTTDPEWRQSDWDARFVAKAIKGDLESIKKSTLEVGGKRYRPTAATRDALRGTFGKWAADRLKSWRYKNPILVAIPNSSTLLNSSDDFETAKIAKAIADSFGAGATVSTVLRFNVAEDPAHKNKGARSPERFYPNMALKSRSKLKDIVLIDDIITSGSHLIAAKRRLAEICDTDIEHALIGAKATKQQLARPFSVAESDLEDPFG